ncbi:Na+/H+ antiporter subunit E [Candidatus Nitrospira bockiana]
MIRAARFTFGKLRRTLEFLVFFGWELIVANLRLAYDIITPGYHMRPGILAIPLDARRDVEVVLLANLLSLTPGTLSLDVPPDKRHLYVHVMYLDDIDAFRRKIKAEYERRVIELLA